MERRGRRWDRVLFTGSLSLSLLVHLVLVLVMLRPIPSTQKQDTQERVELDLVVESAQQRPVQPAGNRDFARRSSGPLSARGHRVPQQSAAVSVEVPRTTSNPVSEVPELDRRVKLPDVPTRDPVAQRGKSATRIRVSSSPPRPGMSSEAEYLSRKTSSGNPGSSRESTDRERVSVLGKQSRSEPARSSGTRSVRKLVQRPPFPYDRYSKRLPETEYRVVYRIVISPEGNVKSLTVQTTSGGGEKLAEEIAKWVRKWKYNPAGQSNARRVVVQAMKPSSGS